MHHDIKSEKPYYLAVKEGRKNFEIRLDDRGYQAGDTVTIRCLNELNILDSFAPPLFANIGYVTAFKQQENYVVFSLLNVTEGAKP